MEKRSTNVNVCFIANYYKTDVFVEIAKTLMEHNVTPFWIIPNRKQYQNLKNVFTENQLLYIGKKEVLSSNDKPLDLDLKINELVYGDRVLREESKNWSFDYLLKLQPIIYNFIKYNTIKFVFGEVTWAHELLVHRITTQITDLECQFLNPHTIRIPNGRFAFFTDEFQSVILEKKQSEFAKESKKAHIVKAEKPSYLALNDKILKKKGSLLYNLNLIRNFITRKNQDKNDPTLYSSPTIQFKIKTTEIINRVVFKYFVSELDYKAIPKEKKKVLFTLHKQPEASIDVIGRYYEDQFNLITNIWRILPPDCILLIKEHSNAIGDRPYSFYKNIKQLNNTYLVNNKEDSHNILPDVQAVFTVSGTIAYEASLKGINAFTFAPAFFNKLDHCQEVSWKMFRNNSCLDNLYYSNTKTNVEDFSNWIIENSYEGIVSDSYGDPRCMSEDNISALSLGFLNIIK